MTARRIAAACGALLLAVLSGAGFVAGPTAAARPATVDYVVVVGAAGLRWSDVDPIRTPTLWRMAERGSIASLAARSAHTPTCPQDGWLTLGAGNYAAWTPGSAGPCRTTPVRLDRPDRLGAHLPDQRDLVARNSEALPWGAVPGALAESLRCTVAVGPGAALAGARPYGRVDRYVPALPAAPGELLASCVLSIVDGGALTGDGTARRAAAEKLDATVATVLNHRPPQSLVLVAGVADSTEAQRLHVAIADGPGWEGGWLTSATTGRDGYLQLIDLAPTVLAALDRPVPARLFLGREAIPVAGRPANLGEAIAAPVDADRGARAQRRAAGWFFGALTVGQVALLLGTVPLLRRARAHAGPGGPAGVPEPVRAAAELALVAAALAIPAALLADVLPWWRWPHGSWIFLAAVAAVLTVLTVGVRYLPIYRQTWGPVAAVAAVAAVTVALDVLTGASLQLNGVAGYSALEGGRYAGIGIVGLGVLSAGLLLAAGCLAQRLPRERRTAATAAVGGLGVLLVGSPYLGGDAVGAIALTAGVCVTVALVTGGWLTFARLAWSLVAGVAVAVGFAALDLRRPPEDQGSLGRFLTRWSEGTGGLTVHRTGVANVIAFATSPLTLLAIAGTLFVWLALLRHWGGLKRLYGIYPGIRAALIGVAVAAVLAGAVGGAALNVAGAAAATAVPLATLAALRVLDHATDRTPAQPNA
ncbi:hypothetical protein GCM10010124_32040 [Pilimelia terevasa]|uniref:Uncharacterized protein n=1 Tax=Pilimelia terevasa TaxID=53372 RepID=A0A8J3BPK9_9ACTN|nr:hypothetical protein [Pilimelia terevasa]GGK37006.1 hypothetical protein GCM10010124_32040 [Pilimelia terevasa]